MEKKNPIEEAQRYVDNAHKTLKDNENYRKLLALLNTSYQILHLSMGYDGVLYKDTCDTGFHVTNDIIDRCERLRAS